MSNIDITLSGEIVRALGLTPEVMQAKLAVLASLGRVHVINLASRNLHGTARQYIEAVQPESMNGFTAYLVLVGRFPNMLEWGAASWNLRDTLLNPGAKNLKVSKEGYRYMSIPFRVMSDDASGRNASPMGAPYRKVFGTADAKSIVKGVMAEVNAIKRAANEAGTMSGVIGRVTATSGGPLLRARHKMGLYNGMLIIRKTYGAATQHQMMSFRTISENPKSFRKDSGGMNWTHPGLLARGFFPKTQRYLKMLAGSVFNTPAGR